MSLRPEFKRAIKLLPQKAVIIEVGSHKGDGVLYMKKMRPKSTIYAIEPDPANFKILNERYDGPCYNIAIGEENTEVRFFQLKDTECEHSRASSLYQKVAKARGVHLIRTSATQKTLDNFIGHIGEGHVDLIRFDCYGGEYAAFEAETHSFLNKTSSILITMHRKKRVFAGEDYFKKRSKMVGMLEGAGFRLHKGDTIDFKKHIHQLWIKK